MRLIDEDEIRNHVRAEIVKKYRFLKSFAYACNRPPNDVYLILNSTNRRIPDWMLSALGIKAVYQVAT